MATAGEPMTAIQAWMGHADIATTMRYAKYAPTPDHERQAIDKAFDAEGRGTNVPLDVPLETPEPVTTGRQKLRGWDSNPQPNG